MTRRAVSCATVGIAVLLAITVGLRMWATPMVQIELYAAAPVAPDVVERGVVRGVRRAVGLLSPSQVALLQGGGALLAAHASAEPSAVVLRAVSVERVGARRVRIRVSSDHAEVAATIAAGVADGIVGAGLRERLRLRTQSTGGRIVLLVQLVTLLAAGMLAVSVAARLARAAWTRQSLRLHARSRPHGAAHRAWPHPA